MAKVVIRNVTKTYSSGAVVALQDINLEVDPYESVCILGPSGCGKTTLLRIIDCLISRDCGEILIDGAAVTEPRPDVAMVFQHFGLFPWKRLDENIAYGLELRGSSKQEIETTVARYLDQAALEPFSGPPPDFLSHSHGEGFFASSRSDAAGRGCSSSTSRNRRSRPRGRSNF